MKHSNPEKNQRTIIPFYSGWYAVALLSVMISLAPCLDAQDENPVDINTVLKTLEQIKTKQDTSTKSTEMQLSGQFLTTAGSTSAATAYYKEAIRATKLDGKSLESLDYQDWEKASADRFKSRSFRDGLSFHLTYLSLTLRHNAKVDMKYLLPDLINYTQQVMADYDDLSGRPDPTPTPGTGGGGRRPDKGGNANAIINGHAAASALDPEFMSQPVTNSVFVKWLHIEPLVAGGDDWEPVPGNVDSIYDKTILPQFRLGKDPRLLQYWDQRIQREGNNAAKTKLNFVMDQFDQITKPRLLWERSQELIVLNQKNRAINDMLAIIKSYPAHPDLADWISQLKQIVSPPPAQTPASETSPATSAPAAPLSPQG